MNKLVVAAAVVLAVLLLGLPGAVGSIMEARLRERVTEIDANPVWAAAVTSYENGWFGSTAKLEIALDSASVTQANPLLEARMPIVVELAHGPVAVLDGIHFGWAKFVARPDSEDASIKALEDTLGIAYLFEFRGRSGYAGGMSFDADAPAFETTLEFADLKFAGATVTGDLRGRQLKSATRVGPLEVSSPTGGLTMSELVMSTDNELVSRNVAPGRMAMTIDRIAASEGGPTPIVEVTKLAINSDASLNEAGTLFDMRVEYGFEAARVEEVEITDAAVGVGIRNLDLMALEAYGETLSGAATDAEVAAALTALRPEIERALQSGPSMTLEPIRYRVDNEPFEARIEITTNTAQLPPPGALDLDNPLQLLGLFDVEAEASVSKPLALRLATFAAENQLAADPTVPPDQLAYLAEAQAGLMLTALAGQGLLVEDGTAGYRATFALTDGALTLNGAPLPFGLP